MAHTDTGVSRLKINRGTSAAISANLGSIGENELIFLTDKGVPIPADKVGNADSVDAGKVVSVDANGGYVLTTPPAAGMTNPMTTAGDIIVGGMAGEPIRLGIGSNGKVLTSTGSTAVWQEFILEVMSAADVNNLFIEGDDEGMKIVLWNTNGTGLSSTLTDALGCDLDSFAKNAYHYDEVLPNVLSKLHVHLTYNGVGYYGVSTSVADLDSDTYGTPTPDSSNAGYWSAAGVTVLTAPNDDDGPRLAIVGVSAAGTDYIYGEALVVRGGTYGNNVSFDTLTFMDEESNPLTGVTAELYFLI